MTGYELDHRKESQNLNFCTLKMSAFDVGKKIGIPPDKHCLSSLSGIQSYIGIFLEIKCENEKNEQIIIKEDLSIIS